MKFPGITIPAQLLCREMLISILEVCGFSRILLSLFGMKRFDAFNFVEKRLGRVLAHYLHIFILWGTWVLPGQFILPRMDLLW
ncbi:hypothetical protein CPSG_04873 [Coccidioides posadasii str. Silveira]|uniref:Uncharacterized protein n=1 Tax=Coccidioides posadasii (strain RMSCC 757 / Silveira) TaxID=443226 RepID=E9D5J3_COCPS|nr:hypothetical protein CPSG_04873 [Coccidioides posadasii str. Silveira]